MAKKLRFSRFRRLPGLYRFGERKPADPNLEPQRLSLYLPGTVLDMAEAQARRAGVETIQEYCERLLIETIEAEHAREVVEDTEARRGPLEGLDAIANDPEYLAEWNASASPRGRRLPARREMTAMPPTDETPSIDDPMGSVSEPDPAPDPAAGPSRAAGSILRHAGLLDDDPSGFLPTLRRGETIEADAAQELLRSLAELEAEYRGASYLDRLVAYALHRLAFEGQILLTDGWPGLPVDEGTIDVLRLVQEGVDRVLSGQDIRYFSPESGPEFSQ